MPDPEFSEFQFAYSVTRELGSNVLKDSWFPHFPTQNQEGDLGYDLSFSDGISVLLIQYKCSKYLKDGRAKDKHWDCYQDPFYRFKVRTSKSRSNLKQHELLCNQAQNWNFVYYVAPQFVKWDDYQNFARNETVIDNSIFINCEDAPTRFDDKDHHICHRPEDDKARFFSESSDPPTIDTLQEPRSIRAEILDNNSEFQSFQQARGEFASVRRNVVERLGLEEEVDVTQYSADDETGWALEQQRFFEEHLGASLNFV